jgi:hypothetical protein
MASLKQNIRESGSDGLRSRLSGLDSPAVLTPVLGSPGVNAVCSIVPQPAVPNVIK